MSTSQMRAVAAHRRRLRDQGIARYEVRGLDRDKELIRKLARRLSMDDTDAGRLRAELERQVAEEPLRRGGILAALRRSPLVGLDWYIEREFTPGRDVDL